MAGTKKLELNIGDPGLREALSRILFLIRNAGGRPLLVGGCVRDALLQHEIKDVDVEVYALKPGELMAAVSAEFQIESVGVSFGVLKVHDLPIDISIPRRESKRGLGHKGFEIHSSPTMSPTEAASRRDFTINAIALDTATQEVIDPFNGERDLREKVLRHTSEKFAEDPLRVLRGMQFAARFDFAVAPETVTLCRTIEPEGLPRERIFTEWEKLILLGVRPSRGLEFLRDCGWIRYFPELDALIGCEQNPEWHPEGDVWIHTSHCMDAFAAERTGDAHEDLIVGLAVLCHDFGKPATTRFEEGKLRSYGHEAAGEGPTRSFLSRITNQTDLIESVVVLVRDHMRPDELYGAGAGDNAVRRLAHRVKRIDRLVRVARADRLGRPPLQGADFPAGDWLLERARAHEIEKGAPKPLVLGRHLIQLGLAPGKQFGELLEKCYQAQLDSKFSTVEEGIRFAKELVDKSESSTGIADGDT
jgi:tRNA nucleotidyltransferase (CCA-adding enzyme)